ncbi:hypothetical protein MKZ38_004530 [Zalerion maritima]|uniref:Uncharacterized protein n=1 Tax=Zalerion maritima TaxID=339359 RepID=A0AAD5WPU5_9PEZI|nr:hypothetical protein MKZ38_004530 [Zalerion maritima]
MSRQDGKDALFIVNVLCIRRKDTGLGPALGPGGTVFPVSARCTLHLTENKRRLSVSNQLCRVKSYASEEDQKPFYAKIHLDKPFPIPVENTFVPDQHRNLGFGSRYSVTFELEVIGSTKWPPVHIKLGEDDESVFKSVPSSHWLISSTNSRGSLRTGAYKAPLVVKVPQSKSQLETDYHLEYEITASSLLPPSYVPMQPSFSELVKRRKRPPAAAFSPPTSDTGIEISWIFQGDTTESKKINVPMCLYCARGETQPTAEDLKRHLTVRHKDYIIGIIETPDGGMSVKCRPCKAGFVFPATPSPSPSSSMRHSISSPTDSHRASLIKAPTEPTTTSVVDEPAIASLGLVSVTAPDVGKIIFHPQSLASLQPGEEVPAAAEDTSWIIRKNIDRALNMPNVEWAAREYAARWALAWDGNADDSHAFLQEVWLQFARKNAGWIVASEERKREFNKDAIIFSAEGTIGPEALKEARTILADAVGENDKGLQATIKKAPNLGVADAAFAMNLFQKQVVFDALTRIAATVFTSDVTQNTGR